ncbi:MAG TPA: PH domain-containing protein [Myxococcota bacterium]|nr:PH domain-containing protein [Myxococcota bacterium]
MDGAPALFRETQRFLRNPWAMIGGLAALIGCGSVLLAPGGGSPLGGVIGLAVFAAVAGLLGVGALHTEVRPDGLYVRLVPLTRQHRFAWSEIVSAESRHYRPILDYGGWGIRFGRAGKAYNVYGSRGVQLVLADGRRLLIGSQRADALAAAIATARGR